MDKINVSLTLTQDELLALATFLMKPDHASIEAADAPVEASPEATNDAASVVEAVPAEEEPAVELTTEPPVTKADLRALGVKLTKAGKTNDLKRAFNTFGAAKLGEVKEKDYPALKKVLEDLIDG